MKKLIACVFWMLLSVQAGVSAQFALGLNAGYRYLDDPTLGGIYGDGYVFEPYIRYAPSPSLGLELSYEGGYKKSAPIGLFQEDSTLTVDGFLSCASGISAPILSWGSGITSINRISTASSSGSRSITKNGRPSSEEE